MDEPIRRPEPLNPGGAKLPLLGRPDTQTVERYLFAGKYARAGMRVDFGCGFGYGTSLLAS